MKDLALRLDTVLWTVLGGLLRRDLAVLMGSVGDGTEIRPPFHGDYGYQIRIGSGTFANFGFVALDVVTITIGDDVWLGGRIIVCPGVTIGAGTVVGAGAVVTRDLPPHVLAVGTSARVVRKLDPPHDA